MISPTTSQDTTVSPGQPSRRREGGPRASGDKAAAPAPARRSAQLPLLGLVALTLLLYGYGWTQSRGAFGDSFHHLINGIFVYDAARDPGAALSDPLEFGYRYYRHFPAVNLGYYLPLFAMIEALLMSVFGVSSASGQFAVLLTAVAMALFMYAWWRSRLDAGGGGDGDHSAHALASEMRARHYPAIRRIRNVIAASTFDLRSLASARAVALPAAGMSAKRTSSTEFRNQGIRTRNCTCKSRSRQNSSH